MGLLRRTTKTGRRATYRAALGAFRVLPGPIRRVAVRLGAPQFSVGAVCAIVRPAEDPSASTVLLLRQHHRRGWTLPGGLLDSGEDSDTAIRRELDEELRVEVDPGLPATTLVEPATRRVDIVYRLEEPAGFLPRPRGEATEAAWLRVDELAADSGDTAQILHRLLQARGGGL